MDGEGLGSRRVICTAIILDPVVADVDTGLDAVGYANSWTGGPSVLQDSKGSGVLQRLMQLIQRKKWTIRAIEERG